MGVGVGALHAQDGASGAKRRDRAKAHTSTVNSVRQQRQRRRKLPSEMNWENISAPSVEAAASGQHSANVRSRPACAAALQCRAAAPTQDPPISSQYCPRPTSEHLWETRPAILGGFRPLAGSPVVSHLPSSSLRSLLRRTQHKLTSSCFANCFQ